MNSFRYDENTAVVETTKGKVRGYEWKGMSIFKGIPYATAKRFHRPEALEPWDNIKDATNYGYVCPLLEMGKPNGELNVPHRYWPMDEDCLNLNIWTPGTDEKKRPVMFWMHGGGFEAGSSIEHVAYDGENMCSHGDVVVVSVNHRLNVLGYFDLSDFGEEYVNSGNAGTDDLIAALKWVQENIAKFGGDPENVVIFGQSGGGAKVTTLLQTPAADGLYAKGINMSGVIGPVLADQKGSGKEFAEAIMRELGILGEKEKASCAHVKLLEEISYEQLSAAYRKLRPEFQKQGKYTGGAPHPNAFYAGEPVENGFRKETAEIPLLVGSVYGEFTSFVPAPIGNEVTEDKQIEAIAEMIGQEGTDASLPLFREAYPKRRPADLLRLDILFRQPEIPYIAKRSALNQCTWSYLFNVDQPINGGQTPWHCSDIPYVFRNIDLVQYPHGDEELAVNIQDMIFETVMAFARTGNPNNEKIPHWEPSKTGEENTLVIDEITEVKTNYDHKLMEVFTKYMGPVFEKMMKKMFEDVQH